MLADRTVPDVSATHGSKSNRRSKHSSRYLLNKSVLDLLNQSLSKATRQSYKQAYKHYLQFASQFYPCEVVFPITVNRLAQYLANCYVQGLSYSTIRTRLSGLSYFHSIWSLTNPANNFVIRKLMYAIRIKVTQPDQRKPITIKLLQELILALDSLCQSSYDKHLYKALYLVSFFGLFRIGEVSITKTGKGNVISNKNVCFYRKKQNITRVSITMNRYKHSKGQRAIVNLEKNSVKSLCPVVALERFLLRRPETSGPCFVLQDGRPLYSATVRSFLRKCISYIGLNSQEYTPHSFRIGGATHAYNLQVTPHQLQALGRWKSSAYKKYIRPST
ncbi:uncharacterized protein LOC123544660 [Mercenaria mercenaria]|uniref:uncharacterized protein LOC123544660 n=1 Tax=Mercenaria mercenaria TaxID=6596 RepID=UPI00234F68FA|nr:uncharacterized protein LOC123544660 [Mercenaria mercenaria]